MLSVDQASLRLDADVALEPGFDFLSAEYRTLYGPRRATAFQAPLWMDMLHRRLAPALGARQHTLTVRGRQDGSLLAVIPLVRQRIAGIRLLSPADFGVCDYNSIVGDRNTLSILASDPSMPERIDDSFSGADILLFRKVSENDFDIGRILAGSQAGPAENGTYQIDAGEDFDHWRRHVVRRAFSKELERLQRQTERACGSYVHRPAETEQEVIEAFEHFREWRAGRFKNDLFLDPLYFDFYRDYAIAGLESGESITYVSYAGNQPIAILFGLAGDGGFHAVLNGTDKEGFGKQSPGLQIIYQVLQRRFAEGSSRIDMGLGSSRYKSQFRVQKTELSNHTKAFTLAGRAVALAYHHAKPLKSLLRWYAPDVR